MANMAAAKRIRTAYPNKAFLRRHPEPKEHMMEDLKILLEERGIDIDISSAGSLQVRKGLSRGPRMLENRPELLAQRQETLLLDHLR